MRLLLLSMALWAAPAFASATPDPLFDVLKQKGLKGEKLAALPNAGENKLGWVHSVTFSNSRYERMWGVKAARFQFKSDGTLAFYADHARTPVLSLPYELWEFSKPGTYQGKAVTISTWVVRIGGSRGKVPLYAVMKIAGTPDKLVVQWLDDKLKPAFYQEGDKAAQEKEHRRWWSKAK